MSKGHEPIYWKHKQMANKYMNNCTLLVIKESEIKWGSYLLAMGRD